MIAIDKKFSHNFLFVVLLLLSAISLWFVRSFLIDIILAGVIAAFFYPVYKYVLKYAKKPHLASLITTLFIALIVIGPLTNFFIVLVKKSIDAYGTFSVYFQEQNPFSDPKISQYLDIPFIDLQDVNIATYLNKFAASVNSFLLSVSTEIVKQTTKLITSFLIILLTVYFLFIDGKKFTRKIMNLTPLSNKHDALLFNTFRNVSTSTILSTFAVAVFQGVLGGVAFWLAGLPGFFPGVLIAISSVLPYVGAAFIWAPTAVYLFLTGQTASAIIMLVIGLIISVGDNFLRAFIIRGKSQIHELIVFFAIIGGVLTIGFWGIVIGPLLVALLITVIQIYEEEFKGQLEEETD